MSIRKQIEQNALSIANKLYGTEIDSLPVQRTRKEFEGDYTLVVFPFTKAARKAPPIIANEIGEQLVNAMPEVESFNVVQGFLNLKLTDTFWISALTEMAQHDDLVVEGTDEPSKIMVEYASPNTNKPLHLGHIRNVLLGYSISEIFKAIGHHVVKANLVNDRGIHICKSMLAWQKFGKGETPESTGMKGDHLVGKYYVEFDKAYKAECESLADEKDSKLMAEAREMLIKWESGNEEVVELWKTMNGWVYEGHNRTYERLGVDFDQFYYESDTYKLGKDCINEGLEKGVFYRKDDGSVWCDLTKDGLDEKLVLRADGTSVYMTQDIGTADLKFEEHSCERSIYVVGNEQEYHFKVLKLIIQKLGREYADGIYHFSYGMIDLPEGKMKSREGTVVDADDLVDEMVDTARKQTEELGKIDMLDEDEREHLYYILGMGALKYFLLKTDPKRRITFNPKESIDFQGNTGPFIQYTHARIKSVERKAEMADFKFDLAYEGAIESQEMELLFLLN
ncbi:MAG: arginine--tRNA ligase, partial [Bacteroidetes bacterium]|nr:arginine--tRNA ligase [Bacteroidota bacterium]